MHDFASVALVDRRGWILLQERDEHPVIDPEKWGFPGGSVEPGETWEQAAYRELAEETGVVLDGGLEVVGGWTFYSPYCGSDDTMWLFAAATDHTDDDIVCGEGRQMVYVDPQRALSLDLTISAGIVLPAFLRSEHYRRMCA